jgi:hypothetical protein
MKRWWYHLMFVAVCAAVLAFLLRAPEVTTPRIPSDADHRDRKDYARCPGCHGLGSAAPMPRDHVTDGELRQDHVKCYFCHKLKEG